MWLDEEGENVKRVVVACMVWSGVVGALLALWEIPV
jgi:hypothetical protein